MYFRFNRASAALAVSAVLVAAAPVAAQTRQTPPPALPARPLAFPAFHETRLPNGMGLVVVENHTHPVANMYLLVRGGSSADTPAKAGTASLLGATLTKGTPTRTASQIAETIEATGGSLDGFSSSDFVGVSATVLPDQLPLAFELVSDVALRPAFPESEVETARQQAISSLRVAMGQPGSVASRRLTRELYGSHPYGIQQTPATVQSITAADLKAFHQRTFTPGNALLVVAGDVNRAQVEQMVRQRFGSWTGAATTAARPPALPTRARTGITLVHRPGSVQSSLRVGFPGVLPSDPDYYALVVMNHILGGGSEGRLFRVLRERHSWTYGAYSNLSRPAATGVLTATSDVRTEVTDSAMAELMSQMRALSTTPVSATELEDTKGFLIGSFPLQIETAAQVASQIATTRMLGLPVQNLLNYRERIAAVTASDIQRVARKYLTTDRAAVVVVGDAPKIIAGLERIAPVTLVDLEGQPLQRSALEAPRASAERFDASRLRASTLTYRIMAQGNAVGTQTVTLARAGDAWTRTTAVTFGPLRQGSTSTWGADFAARSHSEKVEGPMTGEATVQLAAGRVKGQSSLPAQLGGAKTYDVAAVPGMIFEGQAEAALAVADLAPGKTITLPVFRVNPGTVGSQTFKVVGAESVTVPAGTFPAFKVEATGGQQALTIWVRQEGLHVPLRYELQGAPVVVELESMQ
jgi:zinc protease